MILAAESGEAPARRLRALATERRAQADDDATLADAVQKGNRGERVVANLFDVLDGAGWCVLHDRYKPGSTANLDHVVVGPPGVFVIDAKNWKPAPLRSDERGMSLRGHRKDEEPRLLPAVPVVETLAVLLEAHLEQHGPTDEDAVLASLVGTWMSTSDFYRDAWMPTRRAAGPPDLPLRPAARSSRCAGGAERSAAGRDRLS